MERFFLFFFPFSLTFKGKPVLMWFCWSQAPSIRDMKTKTHSRAIWFSVNNYAREYKWRASFYLLVTYEMVNNNVFEYILLEIWASFVQMKHSHWKPKFRFGFRSLAPWQGQLSSVYLQVPNTPVCQTLTDHICRFTLSYFPLHV